MTASQVCLDSVDAVDEDGLVRLFIKHDAHSDIASDLVLQTRAIDKADSHIVTEVYIVAQDMRINQLPDILSPVISHQVSFEKLSSDFGKLSLDDLIFLILVLAVANVTDKK